MSVYTYQAYQKLIIAWTCNVFQIQKGGRLRQTMSVTLSLSAA